MKNVQFGMQEDLLVKEMESLRLSLCNSLGKIVKNKELLEFMITAGVEKAKGKNLLVFAFDAECQQGGLLDLVGSFKEVPEIEKDIVQVYDVVKGVEV